MSDRSTAVAETTTPFAARLAEFGDQVAILAADGQLTYRQLADRVDATARRLGSQRRLVLVEGRNQLDPVVAYLAALSAGHPVLLASGQDANRLEALISTYDPDVVVGEIAGRWAIRDRRSGSAHDLHPELALLLSTSGSTGSPKLVRLSQTNLQSNAEAIATYLDIRPTDRAVTTLPIQYCYGLSVINSHLLRGAAVILTDLSVVDPCCWDLFRHHGATTFAGVPHTFDLLDRGGFAGMRLPSLRYVTQAGGRLGADKVERFARLGAEKGWEFFAMYGQTEATARMAYLPPDLATSHAASIGVPVPGGKFHLEPITDGAGADVGELVYSGPNVMLGYAEKSSDLRLGRTVGVLRTGDIARRTSSGMFELVGRRSRFAKLFGLRIDLQQVEAELGVDGVVACCFEADDELVVGVEGRHCVAELQHLVARRCGLPVCAARICPLDELPRLENGKPDYQAVAAIARAQSGTSSDGDDASIPARQAAGERSRGLADKRSETPRSRQARVDTAAVCGLFAEILARPDATPDDTFVSLEGDSLSYVEMSIRLEELLGHLPPDWHITRLGDLAPSRPRAAAGWRSIETNVALRAAAIVTIVGSHANVFTLLGGAHVLLAVAGFNLARFQLTRTSPRQRLRHQLSSIARIVVPSMACITVGYVLTENYSGANIFLLNAILGPDRWTPEWQYWFVEVLVYSLVAVTAVMAIPAVSRFEHRFGFETALAALAVGLLWRYDVVRLDTGPDRIHTAHLVFWLFALGWASAKATYRWQRLLVTLAGMAAVSGFFEDPAREVAVAVGLCLLVWVPTVKVPAVLTRPLSVLASSSLHIYLVHWLVYPHWENDYPLFAMFASLAAGIAFWAFASPVMARLESWFSSPWQDRRTASAEQLAQTKPLGSVVG
ncbi:MAG: AMP-binding protein [Nocardioidaceae bacterium]|nr:AMP-binding protein [Nocardioidaceae bacterium]